MNDHRRIASLEKRIRRQGLALAGMGIGLIVAVLMGMAHQTPRDMKLENLTITKDGKPRIAMGTNEDDGSVGIVLMDGNGTVRIAAGFDDPKTDPGLVILDSKRQARIVIGDGPAGAGIMLIGAGLTELPGPKQPGKK